MYTQMKTTRIALCALISIGAIFGVINSASAIQTSGAFADCKADIGAIHTECHSDHGACAAGAYSGNGSNGAACAAADYP